VAGLGAAILVATVACSGGGTSDAGSPPELGRQLHQPANFDPSIPGFVACSKTLLEGDVVGVVDGRPGRMLVTLEVDHWVKPATGPDRVRLDLVDIAKDGVYPRWAPGTELRLAIDVDPTLLPSWQFSAAQFTTFEKAISKSRRLTCPYGPGA
jgi:hypothetical protein